MWIVVGYYRFCYYIFFIILYLLNFLLQIFEKKMSHICNSDFKQVFTLKYNAILVDIWIKLTPILI